MADVEYRAATAVDPETLSIHAPTLVAYARRSTELALKNNLVGRVATTILSVAVVRFTGDPLQSGCGLLSRSGQGKNHKNGPKDEKSRGV